jgi:hypothetical protein
MPISRLPDVIVGLTMVEINGPGNAGLCFRYF